MSRRFTPRIALLWLGLLSFPACNAMEEAVPDRNARHRANEAQLLKSKSRIGPYRISNSGNPAIDELPSKPGLYTAPYTNSRFDNSWHIPDQAARAYFAAHQEDPTSARNSFRVA